MRVPWTARRSNQSILKEISPGCSLEGLMLKLNLQYFGHLMQRPDSLKKDLDAEKVEGRREGDNREEDGWMALSSHGHEFEHVTGVADGQRSVACGSPWGCKESDMTK